MKGKIHKILEKIYHDMSIAELQRAYSKNTSNSLSYHDVLYLNIIEAHQNEYTSSQIADLLGITRPSVTQKINELSKKGYIKRTQSKHDKRVYYLSISDEAPDLIDNISDELLEIEQRLVEKYGKEKIDLFCQILEDFSDYPSK